MISRLVVIAALIQGSFPLDCKQPLTPDTATTPICTTWACILGATLTSTTCTGTNQKCTTRRLYDTTPATEKYETQTYCSDTTTTGYDCIFTSSCDVICDNHCTTTDCNNVYTVQTTTATAISCVQCTSEDDTSGSCYASPPSATTCSSTAHQYCTTLHTVVLNAAGAVDHEVVFRGCASADNVDGCWTDHTQVDGTSTTRATSVSCSQTCATGGCNSAALPMSLKGSGVVCEQCLSSHGGCTSVPSTCPSGQSYCYSKVIYTDGHYYHGTNDVDAQSYEVEIVYEERGCRATPLTNGGSCTTVTSDVAGSNLDVISCEESCTGDRCNDGWPLRPKCLQCTGAYWNGNTNPLTIADTNYWDHCASRPPMASRCADPSYKYCYAEEKYLPDGDNEVSWGYGKTFTRGCLKESQTSHCWDYHYRDEKEAHFCRNVCNQDACNVGSGAEEVAASRLVLAAIFAALMAVMA